MAFFDFLAYLLSLLNAVFVPLIFTVAFLVFIWGVFQYFIAGAHEPKKREEGAKYVLTAVIGFVIMFALWGIVRLFINTFGFENATRPALPGLYGPEEFFPTGNYGFPDTDYYPTDDEDTSQPGGGGTTQPSPVGGPCRFTNDCAEPAICFRDTDAGEETGVCRAF